MKFSKMINTTFRAIPLLGVALESYVIGLALDREMPWHILAVIGWSLLVAGTGFFAVQTWNIMTEHNSRLSASEKKEFESPSGKALRVLAVWFGGVVVLTVFLDTYPLLKTLTPVGLVVIGFSASYLFSVSNLHAERVQAYDAYKQKKARDKEDADRKKEAEKKAAKEQAAILANKRKDVEQALKAKGIKVQTKRGAKISNELLLLKWAMYPTLTAGEMAKQLMDDGDVEKITRQAVAGRLKDMVKKKMVVIEEPYRVVEVLSADLGGDSGGVGESVAVESEAGES